MLILLCVAGALILLEAKLAEIGNSAHWRDRARGHLDQIEACVFGASKCFFNRHYADLLAVVVDNANLGNANLAIGSWAGWHRRT
jgi:hypothetical protein